MATRWIWFYSQEDKIWLDHEFPLSKSISVNRSRAVEVPLKSPVSPEELTRLAIRLREDLSFYAKQLDSRSGFAVVMNSAEALILAIMEPEEFRLSDSAPKKASQVHHFSGGRRSIPSSLH
jgi:hypothetical protein